MPHIAQYLLKLSISLSVVYLFYALVLRRLTFHHWNRWYLLGYSLVAFFIPFVNINPILEQKAWSEYTVVQLIPVVGDYATDRVQTGRLSAWSILWFLFIAGMVVMLCRLLVQYLALRKMKRSSQLISDNTVRIYQVNKSIIPFSFGRSIFINPNQHDEQELKEIIRHEFIHVKQRHTADILWSELLCLLNWYNPFAWLIRKAIRQNLEFIADHHVIQAGIDRKQYQYLLLKVIGVPAFAIATQFNFSSLKKRIAMMNRMRSARVHLIKFLFILPLVTVLLLAFRNASVQEDWKHAAAVHMLDEVPLPLGLHSATLTTVDKGIDEPAADTVPVKGRVLLRRIDSIAGKTAIAPYDSTRYIIDASLDGPHRPATTINTRNVLVFIDGVEQAAQDDVLNTIDPANIESISVLKDRSATSLYGEKGRNGVLLITTKRGKTPAPAASIRVSQEVMPTEPGKANIVIRKRDGQESLYNFGGVVVMDGEVCDSIKLRTFDFKPDDIKAIEILKGPAAEAIYGPRGNNGVIIITTKKKDDRITAAPEPVKKRRLSSDETPQAQQVANP